MALSTVTVNLQHQWADQKMLHALGTLVISAAPGTYATGGLEVDFRTNGKIKASRKPVEVNIHGIAGYDYTYIPGTDSSDGKILVRTGAAAQAALTELSAGATPAAVSGDTITFHAMFLPFL